MRDTTFSEELISFIDKSPSPYHVVKNITEILNDFTELRETENWNLVAGGKYYCIRKDSSIIAFNIPEKLDDIRIIASHSDSPSFRVKPHGDELVTENFTRLNVEKYGGMLMAQWLDRPLGIAGRVVTCEDGNYIGHLVDSKEKTCLMPSVAIHMNREVNDGYKYDPKTDTIPLYGDKEAAGSLLKNLTEEIDLKPDDILGYDLFLYNHERGRLWGPDNEYISSRALDDLECAFASVKAMSRIGESKNRMCICCIFDNEEVGSSTGQGADSDFLSNVLTMIRESAGYKESDIIRAVSRGFMLSADNGHARHPNHPELADGINRPKMNGGIVIKYHGGQKYATDAYSEAMIKDVCARASVPYQEYSNRSDIPGGSTLGNILNTHISIRTADIGLAQLSMHSPYETAGTDDAEYMYRAMKTFWTM